MKTLSRSSFPKHRAASGFTLTEMLVVVFIIATLAIVAFFAVRSVRQKAWAANASSNLRQCATAIHSYVGDNSRYPECWDFGGGSGGGSWSWQIRDYLGYDTPGGWPVGAVLHPRHGTAGIDAMSDASRENLHHFAASAIVLQDVDESKTNSNKTYIRPGQISDPSRVIMLGDAPLKQTGDPTTGCHAGWWSLRFAAVSGDGNEPVDETALLKSVEFWMNNKAQFLFIDGHVEALAPEEVKKKNFQL